MHHIENVLNTMGMNYICQLSFQDIIKKAELYINILCELPQNQSPEKRGGYLTIMDAYSGLILMVIAVGDIPQEKFGRYIFLSQEKAKRLQGKPNNISSWESRDVNAELYGGAVRCYPLIVSFSGLSEDGDEALSLALGCDLLDLNFQGPISDSIINLSNNKLYKPLAEESERRNNKN